MQTPWGKAHQVTELADGITNVSTASHGGIKLDRKRNAAIPEYMRQPGGWYEEDCDWAIPFVVFEADLLIEAIKRSNEWTLRAISGHHHTDALRAWKPDMYERFTGIEILPGESYIRDQSNFAKDHAMDLIGVSAFGSWHKNVPSGMVGVVATFGGHRNSGAQEWLFLVPDSEYSQRGQFGFLIDVNRHKEFDFLAEVAA